VGGRKWRFSELLVGISLEPLEIRPTLLYSNMLYLDGFPLTSKCVTLMTLNDHFTLNSVFALVCPEIFRVAFRQNCVKTNKNTRPDASCSFTKRVVPDQLQRVSLSRPILPPRRMKKVIRSLLYYLGQLSVALLSCSDCIDIIVL